LGFSLQQFSEVLRIRDAAGKPYVLIGGQAVNYWAERYLTSEPEKMGNRAFEFSRKFSQGFFQSMISDSFGR